MTFSTSQFQAAHGKRPRGKGNWAFIDRQYADRDDYLSFVFWHNGMYRDAKAAAGKHFAAVQGFSGVIVALS